jgi:hypothetical protein
VVYGVAILRVVTQFLFHRSGLWHQRRFDSLARRYHGVG